MLKVFPEINVLVIAGLIPVTFLAKTLITYL